MSDRQQEVLNAIDLALDGCDEDWTVSGDAMRWQPAEARHDRSDERQMLRQRMADQAALYGGVTAIVRDAEIVEVLDGARVEHSADGSYTVYGELEPYLTRRMPDRFSFSIRDGQNGPVVASSDSIPVCLSPAEAIVPGPNGPIHIRGAYGDEPMQVTEVDLGDIEEERT
jgi:hypothetical protein